MANVLKTDLYRWCKVPAGDLPSHPDLRTRFRVVRDSVEMGQLMAEELVSLVEANNQRGLPTRAIIPCGPSCWYASYTKLVNARSVSLRNLSVFHMDTQNAKILCTAPVRICDW
jgi:glucosamine-6-phosphate deaminase